MDLAESHGQKITVAQSWAYLSLIALCRGDLPSARHALGRLDAWASAEQRFYGMEMVAVARAAIAEAEGHHAPALDVLLRAGATISTAASAIGTGISVRRWCGSESR